MQQFKFQLRRGATSWHTSATLLPMAAEIFWQSVRIALPWLKCKLFPFEIQRHNSTSNTAAAALSNIDSP